MLTTFFQMIHGKMLVIPIRYEDGALISIIHIELDRKNIMHVVHVTSVHAVDDVRILKKQCVSLFKMGYEVSLLAMNYKEDIINGILIKLLPISENRFTRMLRAIYPTVRIAMNEKGNIYHLHDPELLITGQILRLFGKKVIFDMHENLGADIRTKQYFPNYFLPLIAILWKLSERVLLYRIPVIFAERSYKEDYNWIRRSVEILNMPLIDELLKIKVEKKHKFTLGYCGTICEDRGSLVMLHTIQILKSRNIDVNLLCVGKDNTGHLKKMIKINRLDENVTCIDRVSPEIAWKLTAACHIGLALIPPEPKNLKSFFTKIPEYMALGMPVVASHFPLLKQVIETNKCGICVNPKNPEKAANAIEYLLKNPSECKKMGERGREAAIREFDWKNEGKKLFNFYHEVLEKEN
jgi:glycosyltransferase involved in cell wall biosynthesis